MVRHLRSLFSGLLLGLAAAQAMACYTVYDGSSRVMYQGERPPVDMSLPLHQALADRFPGGHLVFDTASECPAVASARLAPVPGGTPLLTNQQTARAMQVPYTAMAGGIALVRPEAASMRPGLTVLPSTTLAAARRRAEDSTRMMGAGPAPRR
jgi:hypothetical protein